MKCLAVVLELVCQLRCIKFVVYHHHLLGELRAPLRQSPQKMTATGYGSGLAAVFVGYGARVKIDRNKLGGLWARDSSRVCCSGSGKMTRTGIRAYLEQATQL